MLMCYPLVLRLLRALPEHEYTQAERAPAWLTVVIGGAIVLCSKLALGLIPAQGEQVLIGFRASASSLLTIDAYTLWGSMLLGAVLAVSAWVPAARRSLVPRSGGPFIIILLLTWAALLMLFGVQFHVVLVGWLALLSGVIGLWWFLFRPQRQWYHLELALVLLLAGVLGGWGLLWLTQLAHGAILTNVWTMLLRVNSPSTTNAVVLLLALGWLGPAAYLPWWLWTRRGEQAMVFLPAALLLATAGHLVLVHVLFLAFPVEARQFTQVFPIKNLFLIRQVLGWMLAWGLLALLAGAGLLTYAVVMRQQVQQGTLRALTLVATGLLVLGIAGGVLTQQERGVAGLLWLQLTWVGVIVVWLAAGGLLPVLTRAERPERMTVLIACWLALAALVALPPLPGFHGLTALWPVWQQAGIPPALVLFTLVLTTLATAYLLPRVAAVQAADTPRPGVGWGIIGPFLLALGLLLSGLLASQLTPYAKLIFQSLSPTFH